MTISEFRKKIYVLPKDIRKESKFALYNIRKELLTKKTLESNDPGVSNVRICDRNVIVSMASYGTRVRSAYCAIESIMQQTIKPNKFLLCVPETMKGEPIPELIQRQQKRGLELLYCKDIWSFRKLIPALKLYPDDIIITCDDDCLYDSDFLENLIISYKKDPTAIWGNRIHEITFDRRGNIKKYNEWNWEIPNTDRTSNRFFITTVGGVLYPPHSLYPDVVKDEIFMEIAKYNDDIWCYAMALLAGSQIKRSFTHSECGMDYLDPTDPFPNSLCFENNSKRFNRNDKIIRAVFKKYGIYSILRQQD
ncbi:MAG: hypothetical protein J5711_05725 [Bacteroidales bacterium]|nr:hypothetical protein [Bacteroidales bacterium]